MGLKKKKLPFCKKKKKKTLFLLIKKREQKTFLSLSLLSLFCFLPLFSTLPPFISLFLSLSVRVLIIKEQQQHKLLNKRHS